MSVRTPSSTTVVRPSITVFAAVLTFASFGALAGADLAAQERDHGNDDHDHDSGLHFTHPLIAESVSPDTKVRFDHEFFDFPDGDQENSGVLEGEYAFTRSFSVEAGLPYSYSATALGNAELLLKFANYAFEDSDVLLGYGLEFGFPTNGDPDEEVAEGEGLVAASAAAVPPSRAPVARSGGGAGVEGALGTDEWEVAPFLNVGFMRGPVELVGWTIFEIPFNQEEQDEVATEIAWNLSGMYHVSDRLQALLELDGSGGVSGEAVGENVVNLSPGLRVQLLPDRPFVLGSAVSFPVADDEPFDLRWKTSLFWHF